MKLKSFPTAGSPPGQNDGGKSRTSHKGWAAVLAWFRPFISHHTARSGLTRNTPWLSSKSRVVTTLGLAAVALVVLGTPASAKGTTISVNTTDSGGIGGTAIFWHDGNGAQPPGKSVIGARDNQADGLRVHVNLVWPGPGGQSLFTTLENANGIHTLITKVVAIPDGTKVTVQVCLRDGPEGVLRYCKTGVATA
jgi:hypothetical protein